MTIKTIKWDGKAIGKAGLYDRVPMTAYHHHQLCVGPSASGSMLRKIITQSPAHMYCTWSGNPEAIEEEEKPHFVLGRAAHHLMLGEEAFSTDFVVRPPEFDSWRTDKSKIWRGRMEAMGKSVLVPKDLDIIKGMWKSLAALPLIREGHILNGRIEQTLIWRDKSTGIWLKNRPDAIPTDSGDVADLKTTSATGEQLRHEVFRLRYDIGAALTKWALKEVLGIEMNSFSLVFIEKKPPYCAEVLTLRPETVEKAEIDLRCALDTFAHCLKTDNWFGPSGTQYDAVYVSEPDWFVRSAAARSEFLYREIGKDAPDGKAA